LKKAHPLKKAFKRQHTGTSKEGDSLIPVDGGQPKPSSSTDLIQPIYFDHYQFKSRFKNFE